jgi:hypothetical protein
MVIVGNAVLRPLGPNPAGDLLKVFATTDFGTPG